MIHSSCLYLWIDSYMKIEAGLFWIRSWDEAGKEKSSSSLKSVFRSIHGGNSVLNIKDLFDPL